jgi:opacity protein-like surface antigen
MSLHRTFVVAALAFVFGPLCHAGTYFKVAGLYTRPGDLSIDSTTAFKASLKNNTGVAGALGYKFTLFRVEAELLHVRNGTEPDESSGTLVGGVRRTVGSIKETSGFANAYVDFPSFFGLAPYVGAGLGYARINVDGVGSTRNNVPFAQFSGRDSVFGYQGMAGLQFHVFGQATLNAGFRLVKREDLDVRDVFTSARQAVKLDTNRVFELGLAIGF